MSFSDYIVYVDESGDHGLKTIDPQYPVFVLSFCIFRKSDYYTSVVPYLVRLKFDFFGHDMVVLHSHAIRKSTGPFKILVDPKTRSLFHSRLDALVQAAPFTLISAIIDKKKHLAQYVYPDNPYELALLFCLERTFAFLKGLGQHTTTTHCIFEARGANEDKALELEFLRICKGANHWGPMPFEIVFSPKSVNSAGLQLADLVGQPIGRNYLNPAQPNQAYQTIYPKFRKAPSGSPQGWGRKVFP